MHLVLATYFSIILHHVLLHEVHGFVTQLRHAIMGWRRVSHIGTRHCAEIAEGTRHCAEIAEGRAPNSSHLFLVVENPLLSAAEWVVSFKGFPFSTSITHRL